MSYILDALRRADTERASGGVPNIHTRPAGIASGAGQAPAANQGSPLLWLIVGLVIGLLAWLGLRMLGGETNVPPPAPMAAAPPVAMAAPGLTAPAPAEPQNPAAPIDVAPATALPMPTRRPVGEGPAAPAARTTAKGATGTAGTAPTAEGAGEHVYTPGELPEEIRRALPALTIGGAMYSQTPASRMLIINGQLFHEGDKPAPGLVLEQIRLKGAVLKFKGYRYAIGY